MQDFVGETWKDHLEDLGVDGTITLEWILKKKDWRRVWVYLARNRTICRLMCCMRPAEANSTFSQFCLRAYKLSCMIMTCRCSTYNINYYLEILPVSRWSLVNTVRQSFVHLNRGLKRVVSDGKGKAAPLQAWSGPEGTRKLRFPDYMTAAQDGGKVVSLTHRSPLPPGNAPGTHFR
jgi:hypothetical protein